MRGLWPASTAGKPSATKLRARVYTHLHAKDPECVYSVVLPLHYAARKAAPGPISLQEYTSHNSICEKRRRDTSARPHIAARTRAELGSRLTQPRRSPHALGSAAQQCAGAPQWSEIVRISRHAGFRPASISRFVPRPNWTIRSTVLRLLASFQ